MRTAPVTAAAVCFALALALGCGGLGSSDPQPVVTDMFTGERVDPATLPPEILEGVAEVSAQQSQGLKGAGIEVHRAWKYDGPSMIAPIEGARLAAAEVTFRGASTGFDLDDIDIIDADRDENLGSDPQIECMLLDGSARVSCFDPVFDEPGADLRVTLIWAVYDDTHNVRLGYWGDVLTEPIPLAESGPSIPMDGMAIRDRASWEEGGVQHLSVRVHLTSWPRHAFLDRYSVRCAETAADGRKWFVDADAWAKLDGQAPLATPEKEQPYYHEAIDAVVDYRIPAGCTPTALNRYGEETPLPSEGAAVSGEVRKWLEAHPSEWGPRGEG